MFKQINRKIKYNSNLKITKILRMLNKMMNNIIFNNRLIVVLLIIIMIINNQEITIMKKNIKKFNRIRMYFSINNSK